MNKIYKLVWSKVRNMWVVASEFAKSHSKSHSSVIGKKPLHIGLLLALVSGSVMTVGVQTVQAEPTPEQRAQAEAVIEAIKNDAELSQKLAASVQQQLMGDSDGKIRLPYLSITASEKNPKDKPANADSDAGRGSAVALGYNSSAMRNATAVGGGAMANSDATAIGANTKTGPNSTAIGTGANAKGWSSMAIGLGSVAESQGGIALGLFSHATREGGQVGYAFGDNTQDFETVLEQAGVKEDYDKLSKIVNPLYYDYQRLQVSGAEPKDSPARKRLDDWIRAHPEFMDALNKRQKIEGTWKSTWVGALSIGDSRGGATRQITDVAAGTEDTDAVNVGQIKVLNNKVDKVDKRITLEKAHYFSISAPISSSAPMYYGNNYNNEATRNFQNSLAIGENVVANDKSIAIGYDAKNYSVIKRKPDGESVRQTSYYSLTGMGDRIYTGRFMYEYATDKIRGTDSIAIGHGAATKDTMGIAIGYKASAGDSDSESAVSPQIAIGTLAEASGGESIAIGTGATAGIDYSIAIGHGAYTKAARGTNNRRRYSVAIGEYSQSTASESMAFGRDAKAMADRSLALGVAAEANIESGVALGFNSVVDRASSWPPYLVKEGSVANTVYGTLGAVSIGNSNENRVYDNIGQLWEAKRGTRQLINLAAGTEDTDAVNVAQLKVVNEKAEANKAKITDIENKISNLPGTSSGAKATKVTVDGKDDNSDNADANLKIKKTEKDGQTTYDLSLNDEITIGKAGQDGKDGKIGINGKDGKSADITVGKGKDGVDGKNGEDGITRIIYNDEKGKEHQVATLDDGLKFKGDNDTVVTRKLNTQLNITGGAKTDLSENNIGVTGNADGSMLVQLAKNLKGLSSAEFKDGDKVTNITAQTITQKDGDNITNITGGNVSITKKEGDTTKTVNLWDLSKTVNTGAKATKVTVDGKDDNSDNADANLKIKKTEKDGQTTYDLSLNDEITIGKKGTPGEDGAPGKDGVAGKIGINGKDGKSADITVGKGKDGVDGKNGEDGITRIIYNDEKGKEHQVATLDDGLKFKGDNDTVVTRKLNEKLDITGGITNAAELSNNNIGVVGTQTGGMAVQLAKKLTGLTSAQFVDGDNTTTITGENISLTKKVEGNKKTKNIDLWDLSTTVEGNTTNINNIKQSIANLTQNAGNKIHYLAIGPDNESSHAQEGNYNNDGADSHWGIAIGMKASSKGSGSIAMGRGAQAHGANKFRAQGVSIGTGARAIGDFATAVGSDTKAFGEGSSAYGLGEAYGKGSIAIGLGAITALKPGITKAEYNNLSEEEKALYGKADYDAQNVFYQYRHKGTNGQVKDINNYGMAIGVGARSFDNAGLALGRKAKTNKDYGVALGGYSENKVEEGVALGASSVADREKGKIGYVLGGDNSTLEKALEAIGQKAKYDELTSKIDPLADEYNSLQDAYWDAPPKSAEEKTAKQKLDTWKAEHPEFLSAVQDRKQMTGAWQSGSGAVSVGSVGATRQITNVAAGSEDIDAVNVAQLKLADSKIENNKKSISNLTTKVEGNTNKLTTIEQNINNLTKNAGSGVHYFSVNSDDKNAPDGTNWNNDGATAKDSIAIGKDAVADGIAIGKGAKSTDRSVVIGENAKTLDNQNVAIGNNSYSKSAGVAIGEGARSEGPWSVAIGYKVTAKNPYSVAISTGKPTADHRHNYTKAVNSSHATVLGNESVVGEDNKYGIAIGSAALSDKSESGMAIGRIATVINSEHGIALGRQSEVKNSNGGIVVGPLSHVLNAKKGLAMGDTAYVENSDEGVAYGPSASVTESSGSSVAIGASATVKNQQWRSLLVIMLR